MKNIKKILTLILVICSIFITNNSLVYADAGGTASGSGAHAGGGKTNIYLNRKMDIYWGTTTTGHTIVYYSASDKNTLCWGISKKQAPAAYDYCRNTTIQIPADKKGAYLLFNQNGIIGKDFCWKGGDAYNPRKETPPSLSDIALIAGARDQGYTWQTHTVAGSSYCRHYYYRESDGTWLDWVFVPKDRYTSDPDDPTKQGPETKTTLVTVYQNDTTVYDISNKSDSELYTTAAGGGGSYNYDITTGYGDNNHSSKLSAVYWNITRTPQYELAVRNYDTTDADGTICHHTQRYYKLTGYTYSHSVAGTLKRDSSYKFNIPTFNQTYYKPYNLNRNGVVSNSECDSLGIPNSSQPLDMSVNNNQGITDGSKIKTVDTNTATRFNVKFNNDQFGLPFTLYDDNPESGLKIANGYNPSAVDDANDHNSNNGFKFNSVFGSVYSGSLNSFNANDNQSSNRDEYGSQTKKWGGTLQMGINGSNSASLTFNGYEFTSNQLYTKNKGFRGGDFDFKTIKTGTYKLYNNSKNYWNAKYTEGLWYTYGISYRGTINNSGISFPEVYKTKVWCDSSTKVCNQPVLIGTFEAKTLGGTTDE